MSAGWGGYYIGKQVYLRDRECILLGDGVLVCLGE